MPGLTIAGVNGTLAPGGQFSGTLTISRLMYGPGALVADGVVAGTVSSSVAQSFREIPLTLTDPDGGVCDLLTVNLGTVFLDQLGVQLDLAPASLDLSTLPRANRPLGNLLCAVGNLLDVTPNGSRTGLLNELLPVVNRALTTAQR